MWKAVRWWEGNLAKTVDVRRLSHPCPPKNTPTEKGGMIGLCLFDRTGLWMLSESLLSEMLPGLGPPAPSLPFIL